MDPAVEAAKADFLQAKGGLLHAFSNTPDDRLGWSPAHTARTPLEQVAHAAESIGHITEMLKGRPFAIPTPAEADPGFRERDRLVGTREEAIGLLEKSSETFLVCLDGMTEADLDGEATAPFGLGQIPMRAALGAAAMHTRWHHAQLDYIQTAYGDHDWHMGVPA